MTIKLGIATLCLVLLNSGCGREGNPYTRIKNDSFQVARKSFLPVDGGGPMITLLGAVHLGERTYYQQVQHYLDKADVVLYEGIGDTSEIEEIRKNCPETRDAGGGHSEAAKQLRLKTQTQHIKKRGHFVHADISNKCLLDRLNIAPDKPLCERLKLKQEGKQKKADRTNKREEISAEVMRNITALTLAKSLHHERGPFSTKSDQTILFYRNKVVMDKLREQLPRFSAGQEILIFYGAGHMPDLEASLRDMGYILYNANWLSAFSL